MDLTSLNQVLQEREFNSFLQDSPSKMDAKRRKHEAHYQLILAQNQQQQQAFTTRREHEIHDFLKFHRLTQGFFKTPAAAEEEEPVDHYLLASKQRTAKLQSKTKEYAERDYGYKLVLFREESQRLIPRKPLTLQENDLLEEQVYSFGCENDEIVDRYNAPITKNCLRTLSLNTWVNDEIVNAYCQMCRHRTERAVQTTHLFSSFFLNTLTPNQVYKYDAVKKWTAPRRGKIDLFAQRAVLFPINLNNVHWIFAYIDITFKKIVVLDSMHGENSKVYNTLFRYLKDEHMDKKQCALPDEHEWEMVGGNGSRAPRQNNSDDCGVFSCMFANLLTAFLGHDYSEPKPIDSQGLFACFTCHDMPRIRQQIQLDVLRGKVFPE